MGCSASKSAENDPITVANVRADIVIQEGQSQGDRKKSIDSGISLNGEQFEKSTAQCTISATRKHCNDQFDRKGIAFDIPLDNCVITGSAPKRLRQSRSETRHRKLIYDSQVPPDENDAKTIHELAEKQIRAEQLRKMERTSVVARQKRRDARARKVQERRRKLQEELEMFQDEEFGDIEVDVNFHDADDYDFTTSDAVIDNPDQNYETTGSDCDVIATIRNTDDFSENL